MVDRIYKLSYPDNPRRPIYYDDAGNLLQISGVLLQGMGASLLMLYPGADIIAQTATIKPSLEEWCEFFDRSDDPLIIQENEDGTIKAILRKAQRSISGAIQQKIWYRDGWQCMYCGKSVPDVQLTIDHFIPLETLGEDDESNYLSCCRQCNKAKGNRQPLAFCNDKHYDFEGLVLYLQGKASKMFINHLQKP